MSIVPLTKSYPHYTFFTMTDTKSLWKNVLADIQLEVFPGSFITVFKPTSLLSLENNIATIAAPNAIHINMLQRHKHLIKQSLDKYTQKDIQVTFIPKVIQTHKDSTTEKAGPLFIEEVIKKPIGHLPRVRPDYTFETLAVSQSNQLAFVSAQNVAKKLGRSYNPLFIYGPVGVGKTHLMQAIANEVYRKNPDLKIIYITSEEFTNEVVEAIKTNDTGKMKKRFRSASLLIIDDVQFIAGKDKVQEELFHTFNILIDNASQIVLSSDKPPSDIKKLEARLSSRFAGGLTVDIEPPDFSMRTAIVLKKSERLGVPISIEVAKIIAEKEQDVRALEGTLLKVITQAQSKQEAVTVDIAEKAVARTDGKENPLHSEDIISTICNYYQIKSTLLKGPKRDASLVKARQITMYLLYKELGLTYVEVGNLLGGRDHTTVMYGVEKMKKMIVENQTLSGEIMGIKKSLRG